MDRLRALPGVGANAPITGFPGSVPGSMSALGYSSNTPQLYQPDRADLSAFSSTQRKALDQIFTQNFGNFSQTPNTQDFMHQGFAPQTQDFANFQGSQVQTPDFANFQAPPLNALFQAFNFPPTVEGVRGLPPESVTAALSQAAGPYQGPAVSSSAGVGNIGQGLGTQDFANFNMAPNTQDFANFQGAPNINGLPSEGQTSPTFGQYAGAIANAPSLTTMGLNAMGMTNPTATTMTGLGLNAALSQTPLGAPLALANLGAKVYGGVQAANNAFTTQAQSNADVASMQNSTTAAAEGMSPTDIAMEHSLGLNLTEAAPGTAAPASSVSPSQAQAAGFGGGGFSTSEGGGHFTGLAGSAAMGSPSNNATGFSPNVAIGEYSGKGTDPTADPTGEGGGGGGGGSTVICTELFSRGLIDAATLDANTKFGRAMGPQALRGYHAWARPLVRFANRSPLVFRVLYAASAPLLKAYMSEIAAPGSSRLGRALLTLGVPVCRWIGCRAARSRASSSMSRGFAAKGAR